MKCGSLTRTASRGHIVKPGQVHVSLYAVMSHACFHNCSPSGARIFSEFPFDSINVTGSKDYITSFWPQHKHCLASSSLSLYLILKRIKLISLIFFIVYFKVKFKVAKEQVAQDNPH